MFSEDQVAYLSAPLDRANVTSRQQSGRSLSYIEGWFAIKEANRIFGFDAWHRETIDIRVLTEKPRIIGKDDRAKDGFGVSYFAKVRVTVGSVVREGCGTGHGIDVDLGLAHESALKEAETDAMKRALMTFGNPFGLALYDKTQSEVENNPEPVQTKAQADNDFRRWQSVIHATNNVDELRAWGTTNRPHKEHRYRSNFDQAVIERIAAIKEENEQPQ